MHQWYVRKILQGGYIVSTVRQGRVIIFAPPHQGPQLDKEKIVICDVESTTSNKGNPYDSRNKMVQSGFKYLGGDIYTFYGHEGVHKKPIQEHIDKSSWLVGFNFKFDLTWLRVCGFDISNVVVWDCQLAEFLLEKQRNPYPSLNQACDKYGFPHKLDFIKKNYWDKGIDTDEIPEEELTEYLKMDLILTEKLFCVQYEQLTGREI